MATSKYYNLDVDTTLGGNAASDYVAPSQKAIKTYIDNAASTEIMWAIYGTTTYQQVVDWVNAGKLVFVKEHVGMPADYIYILTTITNSECSFIQHQSSPLSTSSDVVHFMYVNSSNTWYKAPVARFLQNQIPAGTAGQVLTYTGTAGSVGSADLPPVIQYSTIPTASSVLENKIIQYIGATDANYTNGYFYKCVSDGGATPTYSWEQTDVQPGIPSQSGHNAKYLTTDGSTLGWSDKTPLVNKNTGAYALYITPDHSASDINTSYSTGLGYSLTLTGGNSVAVGYKAKASGSASVAVGGNQVEATDTQAIAIGGNAKATATNSIAIGGGGTQANNTRSIAIGAGAVVNADSALQLGKGTNATASTLQFTDYRLLDADGTIPEDRLADTTNATAGQVLTLDSNLNAIWASGGGSIAIDGTTIEFNSNNQIQAAAVVDQNTGIVKTWTGTADEYYAIVTKDPDTEYIITDDIGGSATDIGQITEDVNELKVHEVIAFQAPTSQNNYTWYRKYADGWVEQGGKTTQTATSSIDATITLPVEMQDTEYTVTFSVCSSVSNDGAESSVLAQTATAISLHADSMASTSGTKGFMWEVKGMAA